MQEKTTVNQTLSQRLLDGTQVAARLTALGASHIERHWNEGTLRLTFRMYTTKIHLVKNAVSKASEGTGFTDIKVEDDDAYLADGGVAYRALLHWSKEPSHAK